MPFGHTTAIVKAATGHIQGGAATIVPTPPSVPTPPTGGSPSPLAGINVGSYDFVHLPEQKKGELWMGKKEAEAYMGDAARHYKATGDVLMAGASMLLQLW